MDLIVRKKISVIQWGQDNIIRLYMLTLMYKVTNPHAGCMVYPREKESFYNRPDKVYSPYLPQPADRQGTSR